jgi:hypothetical protein
MMMLYAFHANFHAHDVVRCSLQLQATVPLHHGSHATQLLLRPRSTCSVPPHLRNTTGVPKAHQVNCIFILVCSSELDNMNISSQMVHDLNFSSHILNVLLCPDTGMAV